MEKKKLVSRGRRQVRLKDLFIRKGSYWSRHDNEAKLSGQELQ